MFSFMRVDEGNIVRVFGEDGERERERRDEKGREIDTCITWTEVARAVYLSCFFF